MHNAKSERFLTTLVFDWGDTLMCVFPDQSAPMVEWQHVEAIPGALEAIKSLHRQYRIVVGTNAAESSAEQVRAALARVGMADDIDAIYTYAELQARKPDQAFFTALSRLEASQNLVMIGDTFEYDILGAWAAGWQTIWYNPLNRIAPALSPLQDGEIQDMAQLPEVITGLELPSVNLCRRWLLEQGASAGLLAHVEGVAAVAYWLAHKLRIANKEVCPILAHRGGLLHDLMKVSTRGDGRNHGMAAQTVLLERNQPALARIAASHLLFSLQRDALVRPTSWEEKVVYLADKMVDGSQLVSIEERLKSLTERYPDVETEIVAIRPQVWQLQSEVCNAAGISPERLLDDLKQAFRQS